jgi:hypothetical protein
MKINYFTLERLILFTWIILLFAVAAWLEIWSPIPIHWVFLICLSGTLVDWKLEKFYAKRKEYEST